MPLTIEQLQALNLILDTFSERYPPKYRVGAEEYKTSITDLKLSKLTIDIMEENMDGFAYSVIAKLLVEKTTTLLEQAIEQKDWAKVAQALAILQ